MLCELSVLVSYAFGSAYPLYAPILELPRLNVLLLGCWSRLVLLLYICHVLPLCGMLMRPQGLDTRS